MKIRELSPKDVNIWLPLRLEALERLPENFLTSLETEIARPKSDQEARLANGCFWGGFKNDTLCGIIAMDQNMDDGCRHRGEITSFYVCADARGTGLGRAMLDHVSGIAAANGILQLELQVARTNTQAIRFYEAAGYVTFGTLPRQVLRERGAETDLFMVRFLDGFQDHA
ncbi:GNAT family N-acetyltransferase [Celeribacter marinus]|uniref:GNAT family N-acetyltransferase n=1 Tax=Celeribacter marinus TaxID=1397108 RepID=UPI003176BE11